MWYTIESSLLTRSSYLQDPNRAPDCDLGQCQLPDCFCSPDGTRVPGNIDPAQVPQMITITFNGAVNSDNINLYR